MKTTKELQEQINNDLQQEINERRKNVNENKYEKLIADYLGYNIRAYLPLKGYKLYKMPNNRPLTLLEEKQKHGTDFVAFINVNEYFYNDEPRQRKIYFDINEDKKTVEAKYELYDCYAMKDARKDEGTIYLLSNPNIKDFSINYGKRTQRHKNRTATGWERYNKTGDVYFLSHLIDALYNNRYSTGCYYYKPEDFDKNGYFLKPKRDELKRRTEQLKREREQARKEQITKEWNACDHTQQAKEINHYLSELKTVMLKYLDFETIMQKGNYSKLGKLRELYISFEKQLDFSNYRNVDEWERYKADKIAEYDFYTLAIKKGVFDRLACSHHYEKTTTGYKIKANTTEFWKDPNRYIQEF